MRALILSLGAVLCAYCSAGVLSETAWQDSAAAQSGLCRVLLCNNAPLVWRGRDLLAAGKAEGTQQAIATFREVLERDPQDPYRWADLGEAFLQAGQKDDARYCYQRVLGLSPRTATLQLRAARFYFRIGENREALGITARILGLVPDYDARIFEDYSRFVHDPADILEFGLPSGSRAANSWLEYLIRAGRDDDAKRAWEWIAAHGSAEGSLAGDYLNFLMRRGHPDAALAAWRDFLGARAAQYGQTEFLFNGGFESEPLPSPFDWAIGRAAGVSAARDCQAAWSGQCSLKIAFDGSENVNATAVSQLSVVPAGAYRLTAHLRTEGVTTDQGIRFRISDAEQPARLNENFGNFAGSTPWVEPSHDFTVPAETRLVRIELIREQSLKFDNKIRGTAWVDEFTLEPIAAHQ